MAKKGLKQADARKEQVASLTAVRIYGVPLEEVNAIEGYTAILFMGLDAEKEHHVEKQRRLWYLPNDKIIRAGAEDAGDGSEDLHWFDLHKDAQPIEELYTLVSLGNEIRNLTAPSPFAGPVNVFAASVGELLGQWQSNNPRVPPEEVFLKRGMNQTVRAHRNFLTDGVCNALQNTGAGNCSSVATQTPVVPEHLTTPTGFQPDEDVDITFY